MRQFDVLGLVVYALQVLLFVPCFWLMMPLPSWLEKELRWHSIMAIGVSIFLTCAMWIVLLVLLMWLIRCIQGHKTGLWRFIRRGS